MPKDASAVYEELAASERKYRALFEESRDGLFVTAPDGRVLDANRRCLEMFGYESKADLAGIDMARDIYADPAERARLLATIERQGDAEYEVRLRRRDGTPIDVQVSVFVERDAAGAVVAYRGAVRDVSERKLMERALARRERQYRTLVENMPDLIVRYDTELRRIYVNPAWEESSGLTAAEVLNVPVDAIPKVPRPVANEYLAALRRALASGIRQGAEFNWVNAHGRTLTLQYVVVPERDHEGKVVGLLAVGRDITAHRRTEEDLRRGEAHLRRLNRTLRTLSAGNEALVRATGEQELLERMCRVIVDTGGHALAWIGCLGRDGRRVETRAWAAGPDLKPWPCASTGSCAAADRAIREARPVLAGDIATDPDYVTCRDEILAAGCHTGLSLPLRSEGRILGAVSIYAKAAAAFDDDEVALLAELADDIGYGLGTLRAKLEREADMRRIHSSMEATIQALASIVELRDPYTAGHQRRVAQLSVAIALELALAGDRIQCLYLAAVVHDIGKIRVPAEILSKPGRLSAIEFDLVKDHVEAGYDILKPIDFPWPIADIVRQHHERLDGSGYPRGVKGEDILLESRILAVADVVEAIMTHRPYRPPLGLDVALAAIEEGRGTLFDPLVVDACVRAFRDRNFAFE